MPLSVLEQRQLVLKMQSLDRDPTSSFSPQVPSLHDLARALARKYTINHSTVDRASNMCRAQCQNLGTQT